MFVLNLDGFFYYIGVKIGGNGNRRTNNEQNKTCQMDKVTNQKGLKCQTSIVVFIIPASY